MILILSNHLDEHAHYVLVELAKLGAKAQLLDLAEFPQRLGLTLSYRGRARDFAFGCKEGGLALDDCGAVWWRRPQWPEISADITRASHRNFALSECTEALQGLWHSLDAFWVNDPARDQVAQRKAYQLRVAQDVGLTIPATLVTNCPQAARDFIAPLGHERVIYKAFSATEREWRETRLLKEDELELLQNVKYSPVIFQEYIPAEVDLRITIVGDQIFPAAVHSQQTSYKVDFRIDIANARITPTELPADVQERLHALMSTLGLQYGAVDMRRTPEGDYVFLEINPAGQWMFIEAHTQQPIAACMARLLHENDR